MAPTARKNDDQSEENTCSMMHKIVGILNEKGERPPSPAAFITLADTGRWRRVDFNDRCNNDSAEKDIKGMRGSLNAFAVPFIRRGVWEERRNMNEIRTFSTYTRSVGEKHDIKAEYGTKGTRKRSNYGMTSLSRQCNDQRTGSYSSLVRV